MMIMRKIRGLLFPLENRFEMNFAFERWSEDVVIQADYFSISSSLSLSLPLSIHMWIKGEEREKNKPKKYK